MTRTTASVHPIRRWVGLAVGVFMTVGLAGCAGGELSDYVRVERKPVEIKEPAQIAPSVVLAKDGSVLAELRVRYALPLAYEDIPEGLEQAVVAAEDRRFYEHNGVDVQGIARALVVNMRDGTVSQGGSTITQQLVKNRYLKDWEQTLDRKAREANYAIELELHKSKHEILAEYLNSAYFGQGAYGVQAAAMTYFGQPVDKLALPDLALLVALLRSPTQRNPIDHPKEALAARNVVLDSMVEAGMLSASEVAAHKAKPLGIHPQIEAVKAIYTEPQFIEYVKREMGERVFTSATRDEITSLLSTGGYTVRTTLDPYQQAGARAAAQHYLHGGQPDVAIASVEPTTGAIRALIGTRKPEQTQFDLATQGRRQPGSLFKVFSLVSALEAGWTLDHELETQSGVAIADVGPAWQYTASQGPGMMTLEQGMIVSANGVYARLGLAVGPKAIVNQAHQMGITSPVSTNPSVVLGGLEVGVTPLEMASSFGTLANGGVHSKPFAISSIEDRDGEAIYGHQDEVTEAVTPKVARAVTHVLGEVVTKGTGKRARVPGREIAGKTGTTNNNTDAWFVGFTSQLSTAVWVGYPEGAIPLVVPGIGRIQGGTIPAQIFARTMGHALANAPVVPLDDELDLAIAGPSARQTPGADGQGDGTGDGSGDGIGAGSGDGAGDGDGSDGPDGAGRPTGILGPDGRPMTPEQIAREREIQQRVEETQERAEALREQLAPDYVQRLKDLEASGTPTPGATAPPR